MPTYEYECAHCARRFDIFQKITDAPLENCPKCSRRIKRLISAGSGIIFSRHNNFYTSGRDPAQKLSFGAGKGKGFYATDYAQKTGSGKQEEALPVCPKMKEGCNACQPKK